MPVSAHANAHHHPQAATAQKHPAYEAQKTAITTHPASPQAPNTHKRQPPNRDGRGSSAARDTRVAQGPPIPHAATPHTRQTCLTTAGYRKGEKKSAISKALGVTVARRSCPPPGQVVMSVMVPLLRRFRDVHTKKGRHQLAVLSARHWSLFSTCLHLSSYSHSFQCLLEVRFFTMHTGSSALLVTTTSPLPQPFTVIFRASLTSCQGKGVIPIVAAPSTEVEGSIFRRFCEAMC